MENKSILIVIEKGDAYSGVEFAKSLLLQYGYKITEFPSGHEHFADVYDKEK